MTNLSRCLQFVATERIGKVRSEGSAGLEDDADGGGVETGSPVTVLLKP